MPQEKVLALGNVHEVMRERFYLTRSSEFTGVLLDIKPGKTYQILPSAKGYAFIRGALWFHKTLPEVQ